MEICTCLLRLFCCKSSGLQACSAALPWLLKLIIFIGIFSHSISFAQSTAIRGFITDSTTSKPLRLATIKLAGTLYGAISDTNGYYLIKNIPQGTYDLEATCVGYKTFRKNSIAAKGAEETENISLEETQAIMPGVVIKPQEGTSDHTGSHKLDNFQMQRISGNLDDVIKSVSIHPGVAQISNYHNDLIVKGGGPAENLFVVDGIELTNINHFGSLSNAGGTTSFINMDFVKSAGFSSSGFPSLFGDKISSVTEVEMMNGNKENQRSKVILSATQFALNFDGPLNKNTTYIFSARRSYLDLVFKFYGFKFAPQYYDIFGKINSRLNDNSSISFLFIGVLDKIKFFKNQTDAYNQYPRAFAGDQDNIIAGINYSNTFGDGYFNISLSKSITHHQTVPNIVFLNKSSETENTIKLNSTIRIAPESELSFSASAKFINYYTTLKLNCFSTTFSETLRIDSLCADSDYFKAGLSLQFNQSIGKNLRISFGLRGDYFNALQDGFPISPRISLNYIISPSDKVMFTYGIYRQSPEYLWLADNAGKSLKNIKCSQMHISFGHNIKDLISITLGGFLKKYSDYPASITRPYLVMLNAGAGFSGADDNFCGIGLDPMISAGNGVSKGVEIHLRTISQDRPLWGSISLTCSNSRFSGVNRIEYPGSYDQAWNFILTSGYILNENWEIDLKFRYASGIPFTPFEENGLQRVERYNSARMEDQHYLDIRIDRKWVMNAWKIRAFLDIQNIYNNKVRTFLRWDRRENKIADDPVLGVVPSLGITLEL